MFFDEKNLIKFGGQFVSLRKNDIVFREGDKAQFCYWLIKGEVHLYNSGAEGKEFLQMKITEKQCFGEPAMLLDLPYPATALVMTSNCEMVKMKKENFYEMMLENPKLLLQFTIDIAKKTYDKTNRLREIVYGTPEDRLMAVLHHFKREHNYTEEEVVIPFTRRELANTTGLCIETVIRTVKKLEKNKKLKIINRKIHI